MNNFAKELRVMTKAAKKGGKVVDHYFGELFEIETKTSAFDLRTQADTKSEDIITDILENHFPDYNIDGEENDKKNKDSDYTFVVDPLDGTNNFALEIPAFAVIIALYYKEEIVASVIHIPPLRKTLTCARGAGAFADKKPLILSQEEELENATLAKEVAYTTPREKASAMATGLKSAGVKRLLENWTPGYDFFLLASGRIESVVAYDQEWPSFDYPAGILMIQEAGGEVTDWQGNPFTLGMQTFVASANKRIHKKVLDHTNSMDR